MPNTGTLLAACTAACMPPSSNTAAYWAAYCEREETAGYTSLDLSVDNLAMARDGVMVAEGRTFRRGRSI